MDDVAQAAQTIADFLQVFTSNSGLRLRYRVKLRGVKPASKDGGETATTQPEQGVVNDGPRSRQRYGYYGGYGARANGATGISRADMENSLVSPPDLIYASEKR